MKQTICNFWYRARFGLLGTALMVLLACLTSVRLSRAAESAGKNPPVTVTVNDAPVTRDAGHVTTSFAPIVKKVAQSVVQIDVSTKPKRVQMSPQQMPFGDDMLRRFFGGQIPNEFTQPGQAGLGSGVIVNKDGYIISNNHVVDGADTISVTLNDGRKFDAKVIGRDPKTDIAVLKIDAKDLPFVTIADSDRIEVGDVCLAIGNPFGIGQTVTMGIISATGRNNVGIGNTPDDYEDFLQTDAAINPGNSGGALVDTEGRLIGINTAILSRSGGYQGIGFAVPSNLARDVMQGLVTNGKVVRGYLGIGLQNLTPDLKDGFKLKGDQQGVLVGEVVTGSPADKAGFKSGDVITSFNDKPVMDSARLRLQVAETTPGSSVPVKILRDGKSDSLTVKMGEKSNPEEIAKNSPKVSGENSSDTLDGVTVADIDSRAAHQLNVPSNVKGALVTDVDQNSAAYQAGIRPGSVIQEINHKPVANAADAVKLTSNVREKKTVLRLWTRDPNGNAGSRFVVVDESKEG